MIKLSMNTRDGMSSNSIKTVKKCSFKKMIRFSWTIYDDKKESNSHFNVSFVIVLIKVRLL